MRVLLLFVVIFLFVGAATVPDRSKWVIDATSQLIIHGNTNVNRFTCALTCYNGYDTLEFVLRDESCELIFSHHAMIIPVNDFECGSKQITSDFLETMKATKHPYIHVRFLSLAAEESTLHKGGTVNGKVAITIAGITKKYELAYAIPQASSQQIRLKGIQEVCFSDFNLSPPEKLFGLIQVQQDLKVEFILHLRPV